MADSRSCRPILKAYPYALAAIAFLSAYAFGQGPSKAVIYNNLEGDGGVELDRAIKEAYSAKYTIVDTSRSAGYVEPGATEGSLPKAAKNEWGQLIIGYALVAYIVTADGLVADPVVLKATDERLSKVALEAMAHWRFTPGRLKGAAVATTAAQEFNFGPMDVSNGYKMERACVYQPNDLLVKRMPPPETVSDYLKQLRAVVHNFFVGSTTPETFHVVVVTRPGARSRVWFVSSIRPGSSKELEPLRRLLEAVPPLEIRGGPVILAMSGTIAGGDGKDPVVGGEHPNPVPSEWQEAARALGPSVPISSDAFLDRVWPDAR